MFKWVEGRKDSGYSKLKLLESKFLKFDMYILKFPTGSYVEPHHDKVEGHEHHRLNVILNKKFTGGMFCIRREIRNFYLFQEHNRIIKFRPDEQLHAVSQVLSGTRYVLSIGWLK
jgi:hypothetical protein